MTLLRGFMREISTFAFAIALLIPFLASAQTQKTSGQGEWEKIIEAAKKEGKVVVSVPAGPEISKALGDAFTKRFGIEVEFVSARGSAVVRRIIEESAAGVHYFDIHVGGSESITTGFLPAGILEPIERWWILPEVKDPKNWWGGHMWVDSAKLYVYMFQAYQTQNMWYNSTLVKPQEFRSLDNLLDAKWKEKIGLLDPRTPGSGSSMWSYLLEIKGEDYLQRLVGQKLFISRDQRQLAEALAKGKIALDVGLTYYSYVPFLKAGLPIKPLPLPKEGLYASGGSGNLTIIKNPPHPNATKVFVNWLLGKEGQQIFGKAIGQATRRLNVDTKWLKEFGVLAAKDFLTVEQFYKLEDQSEEKVYKVREPGAAAAHKLLD